MSHLVLTKAARLQVFGKFPANLYLRERGSWGRALQNLGEVNLVVVSDGGGAQAEENKSSEFRVYCGVDAVVPPPGGLRQRMKWWLYPRSLNLYPQVAAERGRVHVCSGLSNFDLDQ
jgi:hypothetical protein